MIRLTTSLATLTLVTLLHPALAADPPQQLPPHEQLQGVLWTQTAVEHDVLCIQAYRLAAIQLEKGLADRSWTAAGEQKRDYEDLPPAVILDVDETVLDNSLFQARLVKENTHFTSDRWTDWVREEKASLLPGAKAFLELAKKKEVAVFFVTNRAADTEEATVKNLAAVLGWTITKEAVLCKYERPDWTSDKTTRRAEVAKTHRILLLIGDDFNDFVTLGKLPPGARLKKALEYRAYWGTKWIQLPNPMYGHWESAVLDYDWSRPAEERRAKKYGALRAK